MWGMTQATGGECKSKKKKEHAVSGWRDQKTVLTIAYFYCSFSPVKKEGDTITLCFLHSASSLKKIK